MPRCQHVCSMQHLPVRIACKRARDRVNGEPSSGDAHSGSASAAAQHAETLANSNWGAKLQAAAHLAADASAGALRKEERALDRVTIMAMAG